MLNTKVENLKKAIIKKQEELNMFIIDDDICPEQLLKLSTELDKLIYEYYCLLDE